MRSLAILGATGSIGAQALPLRVVTFSLQGPDTTKVQLLIHVDVGTDYTAAKRMSLGYMLTDTSGRILRIDPQRATAR